MFIEIRERFVLFFEVFDVFGVSLVVELGFFFKEDSWRSYSYNL